MRWFWRVLLLAAVAAVALAPAPGAADTRIGYIDSARIFQEYKDAQDAQARFDRQVQGWRDEATEKETAVAQLRKEVQDQSPILSSVKRQEREEALQRAISDYEKFIQDVWGPGGKAAQANDAATNDVVNRIRAAVEKVAGDKGYNVVLDSSGGFIIYIDKSMDLTGDVLQELATQSGTGKH
jgi:Skp family chaperone for outer membrane proteins